MGVSEEVTRAMPRVKVKVKVRVLQRIERSPNGQAFKGDLEGSGLLACGHPLGYPSGRLSPLALRFSLPILKL